VQRCLDILSDSYRAGLVERAVDAADRRSVRLLADSMGRLRAGQQGQGLCCRPAKQVRNE
jgi:hypothetical protein